MTKYGSREGLADRLNEWATQLGRDKKYPWIGTGIIDDLRAAASAINGETQIPVGKVRFDVAMNAEEQARMTIRMFKEPETVEYDL